MIAIIVISKLIKEKNKRSDTKPHDDDDDGDDHQMDVYIESYKKPYTRDYRPRLKPDDFLKDKVDTFLAIDFETATGSRNSACQLGLVLVENRVIVKEQTMLIQPPENKYNVRNTAVHGISASKTADSPNFLSVWPDIEPLLSNYPIVCHNASFDYDVLEKTCEYYDIKFERKNKLICTYRITGLPLIEACQALDVCIDNHHDALSDARMCAEIYIKMLNGVELDTSLIYIKKGGRKEYDADNIKRACTSYNDFFMNKTTVITGMFTEFSREELTEVLLNKGASLRSSVNGKTQIIVMGYGAGPSKMEKARELIELGKQIEIIDEKKLLEIIL
jgi:DNA polymerase-3 subunit epsilon